MRKVLARHLRAFAARHIVHICLLRPFALLIVLAINLAHPFLHQFEGGSVDAALMQLDVWALSFASVPGQPEITE